MKLADFFCQKFNIKIANLWCGVRLFWCITKELSTLGSLNLHVRVFSIVYKCAYNKVPPLRNYFLRNSGPKFLWEQGENNRIIKGNNRMRSENGFLKGGILLYCFEDRKPKSLHAAHVCKGCPNNKHKSVIQPDCTFAVLLAQSLKTIGPFFLLLSSAHFPMQETKDAIWSWMPLYSLDLIAS